MWRTSFKALAEVDEPVVPRDWSAWDGSDPGLQPPLPNQGIFRVVHLLAFLCFAAYNTERWALLLRWPHEWSVPLAVFAEAVCGVRKLFKCVVK